MSSPRDKIMHDFAKWTAARSTRNFAREMIYRALDDVDFSFPLQMSLGPITHTQFNLWHRDEAKELDRLYPDIVMGWIVKIINIYLKTRCYIGNDGREGIREVIHPPMDRFLIKGLKEVDRSYNGFDYLGVPSNMKLLKKASEKKDDVITRLSSFKSISSIRRYDQYQTIILACEAIAVASDCSLFEVEQFWSATDY